MARVFAVGDANVDVFCLPERLPSLGEEAHGEIHASIGGNAANFAAALGRLGGAVELVSVSGADPFSHFIRSELSKSGVSLNLAESSQPSGISLITLNRKGERSIVSSKGACAELTTALLESRLLPHLRRGDVVYIGGFFHLPNMHRGFASLLKRARIKGSVIMLDLCFDEYGLWMKSLKPIIKLIDVLFMDALELWKLTGEKDMLKAIKKLQEAGAGEIVLKLGKSGSAYFFGKKFFHSKAPKTRCVNSTGAGDVFDAGFVLGRMKGLDAGTCLRLGNMAAAEKVRHHGIVVPSRAAVDRLLGTF